MTKAKGHLGRLAHADGARLQCGPGDVVGVDHSGFNVEGAGVAGELQFGGG